MKIRGNVVGTNQKPEKVVVRTTNLTDDQKSLIRKNTGAVSMKDVADRLCPSFTESGAIVTCEPVEGYPLGVVSEIEPVQPEGVPSPTNICPITGHTSATLLHQEKEIAVDFGQTVYGGSLNWNTGELTVNMVLKLLDGKENWSDAHYTNVVTLTDISVTKGSKVLSNIFQSVDEQPDTSFRTGKVYAYASHIQVGYKSVANDLAGFKTFLAEQYSTGTPVQLCYTLKDPITIQLTPHEIIALSNANTLCCDTGDTTVTGKADPAAIINKLTNAILSLGGNV